MSFIRQKSEFNIDAAEELIKLSNYAPSVHCSYYATFQLIKYTLKKYGNITYDQIDKESKNKGSHKYLIQKARSEEHTSELQSRGHLVCRLLLEKKKSK